MSGNGVLAWVLTYLLHSTLLLCLAWLFAGSRLARRSAALAEAFWRFALLAPPLTSLLQVGAGWEPLAGQLALPAPEPSAALAWAQLAAAVPASAVTAAPWYEGISLTQAAAGLWVLGAALLLGRLAFSWVRFSRRLVWRPRVVGGGLRERLDRLAGPGIGLTSSSRVSVPIAMGLSRGEICVPPRALLGLSHEEQEGMLAHELAHVARRDPLWLLLVNAWCAVFFFQPLNWVARRRLRELSEVLSDAWAVERTGRPLSLARCLTEVAGWSVAAADRRPLPVPGMADRPSHLAQRINRLLDGSSLRRVRPGWLALAGVLLLGVVAVAAPAISAGSHAADGEPPSEKPAVAEEVGEDEAGEELVDELADAGLSPREIDRIRRDLAATRAKLHAALAEVERERRRMDQDVEPAIARAHEALERALEGELAEAHELIDEKTRADLERLGHEIEASLAPHLEGLHEEIERAIRPELDRLEDELEELDLDVDLDLEHELTGEQVERLREQAQRLAREATRQAMSSAAIREAVEQAQRYAQQQALESDAIRDAVEQAQRLNHEAVEKAMAEHRAEMEALHKELYEEARALAEQARRQVEKAQREKRREREKERPKESDKERDRQ